VSNEGKEIRCKAAAEARVDLQQKRLTLRNFVIDATKSLESDRRQYLPKQIQIWATMNDTEERSVLSFQRCVDGEFIFDVQSLHDFAFDKQNMRGKLRGSHDEFLVEVFGICDAVKLHLFVVVVADDVTVSSPRTDTLFQDARRN
jgi:hypothetical protein